MLGSICSFLNGGTPSRQVTRYYQGDIPWITGADISGSRADTARSFITEEAIRESATNRVPAGTVLLVTRTSVGKVAVATMELCFSQDITAIMPDPNFLDTSYLVHFLRTKQPHFERLARGATIKGVTRESVQLGDLPSTSARAAADCGNPGQGRLVAGQAPRRSRPSRHPRPIHFPRYVRGPHHESEGMARCPSKRVHRADPDRSLWIAVTSRGLC